VGWAVVWFTPQEPRAKDFLQKAYDWIEPLGGASYANFFTMAGASRRALPPCLRVCPAMPWAPDDDACLPTHPPTHPPEQATRCPRRTCGSSTGAAGSATASSTRT
jgi:hypothetical protein